VSGQRVGCQRVSSRVQHPQRQLDGIVLVQTCPDRLLGTDVDRPQLTEVLRFVRAGDMVTVYSRAGGRRRPLAWSRSGTPQRRRRRRRWWPGSVRGCRRSRPARRIRRCCVVSPGDSRGAGFGVEGVSRRSRRLLVSRSRVDGLHRTGCGGVGPRAGVGTGGLGPRGAPGWVGALGMRQFVGYSRQGSIKSAGNPARRVFTSRRTRPRSPIPAGYDWGREPAALNTLSVLTVVQPSLDREQQRKRGMSVLVFVLLTVAIFAVIGLIQKVVERL